MFYGQYLSGAGQLRRKGRVEERKKKRVRRG